MVMIMEPTRSHVTRRKWKRDKPEDDTPRSVIRFINDWRSSLIAPWCWPSVRPAILCHRLRRAGEVTSPDVRCVLATVLGCLLSWRNVDVTLFTRPWRLISPLLLLLWMHHTLRTLIGLGRRSRTSCTAQVRHVWPGVTDIFSGAVDEVPGCPGTAVPDWFSGCSRLWSRITTIVHRIVRGLSALM